MVVDAGSVLVKSVIVGVKSVTVGVKSVTVVVFVVYRVVNSQYVGQVSSTLQRLPLQVQTLISS